MSIVKPYTFVGGTKARASEVNANFDRLYGQVNSNITDIANAQTAITNLGIDKANVAGNSQQTFSVADATSDYHAVNKQTLMGYISNSLDIISGLQISKNSSSPNNSIIVSPGSCYDNGREIILKLANSTSKTNSNQLANGTYYVYIIGDSSGTTIDILISANSVTPDFPSGYSKYRQIGKYKTDSSNKISDIFSYGINTSTNIPSPIATLTQSYRSGQNGYIIFSNGFKIQWGRATLSSVNYKQRLTVSFLVPFTTSAYNVSGSSDYEQTDGDKSSTWAVSSRSTTSFSIFRGWEYHDGDYVYWLAVGF